MENTIENSLTQEVDRLFQIAKDIAKENSNAKVEASHILKALLNRDFDLLKKLESYDIDVYYLDEWADVRIEQESKTVHNFAPELSDTIETILDEAQEIAEGNGSDNISLFDVLVAISTPGVAFSFDQLKTFPCTRKELLETTHSANPIAIAPEKKVSGKYLNTYTQYLNALVEANENPSKIIGRDAEVNKIIETLARFNNPNLYIIGEKGVGKTKLVKGFVQRILNQQVPKNLSDSQVFSLDLGELFSKASYQGEIEDRIKNIAEEIRSLPNGILFIEDFGALFPKQSNSNVANVLNSQVLKGLTLIVSSTIEEYTKKIESESGLSGLFEIIKLEESPKEVQQRIIEQAIKPHQEHHKITVDEEVIEEAIRLSDRFLKDKRLPLSAIELIDSSMSMLNTSSDSFIQMKNFWKDEVAKIQENPENLNEEYLTKYSKWLVDDILAQTKNLIKNPDIILEKEKVNEFGIEENLQYADTLLQEAEKNAHIPKTNLTTGDLAIVVSEKTNIPLGKLHSNEKSKLENLESLLERRVVGQQKALETVSEAIIESRSGLAKPGQPIGSFFFLGPTGTGKTELAKALAEFLFQDENAIIRFDMSEFKEEHSAALLYGAPPGYVGYEEGGVLVNKIREKPYSIVLFDEIEKAHTSVFDVFLQIMDEGKLHDRLGKEGDFSHSIVLFTSNIGSELIVQSFNNEETLKNNQLIEMMGNYFRPEFLGRLTEVVPFNPIIKENALQIFDIHLRKELIELAKKQDIELEIDQEVKEFLTESGFDQKFGARPLKGVIRNQLRRPLAKQIIQGKFKEGDKVKVSLVEDKIQFNTL